MIICMISAAEPNAPTRRFRTDHSKLSVSRLLELKKIGELAGYNFIGWLNRNGKLVQDECPQSPQTPIYWKKSKTDEWFCFSQTALHDNVIKHAILSVDDWKNLVESFSKKWRFLGFVHDASGQYIIHVPPPISSLTGKRSGDRNTKVMLDTEHGRFDVYAFSLKEILEKEVGALPLGCKMRLVPRPCIGLLQAMQCRRSRGQRCTPYATGNSSEHSPINHCWQVRSDAPSVVKDCLQEWNEGVDLDIYARRLLDRHAQCADKHPNMWFCPPSPSEAARTDWNYLLADRHQSLIHTHCWYDDIYKIFRRLSMENVSHDTVPLMGIDIDTVRVWLSKFPVSLILKSSSPTHFDHCQVEIQDEFLQQTHSLSIRDLKRLTNYHKLATEIVTAAITKETDELSEIYYIGTLLTHEKELANLPHLQRFFTNYHTYKLQSQLSSHEQTALPFKLSDFMHVPDRQTLPSGNWLVIFKSGRTSVQSHTSYTDMEKLYRQLLRRDGHRTHTKGTKQQSQGSRKRHASE